MRTTTLGSRLLGCAVALAAFTGCGGGSGSGVTTTTVDEEARAVETMCDALGAYTEQEDRGEPRTPPRNLDQAGPTTTGAPREDPRLAPLLRLEQSLTADVPEEARLAVARMKELRTPLLPAEPPPTTAPAPTMDEVLDPLFAHLDPVCGTRDGRFGDSVDPGPTFVPTTAPGGPTTVVEEPAAEEGDEAEDGAPAY